MCATSQNDSIDQGAAVEEIKPGEVVVRGMGAGRGALQVLVLALGIGVALAGCAGSPTLLDDSDFTEAVNVTHGRNVNPPGWTWCNLDKDVWENGSAGSALNFDGREWAAATIVDGTVLPRDPLPSAKIMREAKETAWACEAMADDMADANFAIEPLDGLSEGAIGWRTRVVGGKWGEYVMVPLDAWRLLVVGFETDQEQPPVDIDKLVSLATEGAVRFPVGSG